jgi:hypothetical protein
VSFVDFDQTGVGGMLEQVDPVILPRKAVRGFLKERPENGIYTKQVCAAV